MLRRGLGVAAVLLVFASPVRAGTLGLAEVRSSDGTLLDKPGVGDSEGDCSKTDLEDDLARRVGDLAVLPAHDSGQTARALAIGDDHHLGVEHAIVAVERA